MLTDLHEMLSALVPEMDDHSSLHAVGLTAAVLHDRIVESGILLDESVNRFTFWLLLSCVADESIFPLSGS